MTISITPASGSTSCNVNLPWMNPCNIATEAVVAKTASYVCAIIAKSYSWRPLSARTAATVGSPKLRPRPLYYKRAEIYILFRFPTSPLYFDPDSNQLARRRRCALALAQAGPAAWRRRQASWRPPGRLAAAPARPTTVCKRHHYFLFPSYF